MFEMPKVGLAGRVPAEIDELLDLSARPLANETLRRLQQGWLPKKHAVALVPRLWLRFAPRPLAALPPEQWRELFEAAGYTDDGSPQERPTKPLRLYRGGSPDGWSWTDEPVVARAFASGLGHECMRGDLWATDAPPDALLAWVPAVVHEPSEKVRAWECVVDPERLVHVRPWTAEELAEVPEPPLRLNGAQFQLML